MHIQIRNECENYFKQVEELTREAFWDHHVPGCDEHYLVHVLRSHPDFIHELDFVAIADDKIVGNIMYTKSRLINEDNMCILARVFLQAMGNGLWARGSSSASKPIPEIL